MPKQSNKQLGIALYEASKDVSGADLEKVINNFVLLLVKIHKFKQANNIIAEFTRYAKKQQGIMDIEITSARKLDTEVIDNIKNIFGKQTASVEKIDPELKGGVVIKTEEVIFDASLKTQLVKLKQVFQ